MDPAGSFPTNLRRLLHSLLHLAGTLQEPQLTDSSDAEDRGRGFNKRLEVTTTS